MKYELVEAGDASCTLKEITPSSTAEWPIPQAKAYVQERISEMLLADDDVKHIEADGLIVEIMREHVRLIVGSASFSVKWRYVFGLLTD